jgi:DNA-binding transcriptional LysR family regulator
MLTLAGQDLLPRAQDILSAARQIINHAKSLKGQLSGQASIGISLTADPLKLGPWVAALSERYPLLDLRLHYGVTGDVLNLVRKKELNAGFYLGKNPYANVNTVFLSHVPLVLAMPASWSQHLDVGQGRELGKLPWIGLSQFSSMSRITSELWRELNISPRKVIECDNLDATMELVMAGVGLALVREEPALAMQQAGRLRVLPMVRKLAELQFVYPADQIDDPIQHALMSTLTEIWQLPSEPAP